ncbi:hypothetical protein [Pigmentiphaga litoralis]|uniref:Uncharacterized protein n=1 Tax=Pigmentiphaga litoralis TaxID=516702 RepID=A0A7Y9LQ27_9BURK|nr:hypothetical protein [Pigmentiphaga litoralis]NYE26303.1 hypothetical protein [Pigmentiphaga litoralis]NYE85423.1 hypothetical protein [Pigmentiphaga litoralis]
MTKLAIAAAITVALSALPAAAQLASPQWSRPAMDSTHVTGTAARVMPEIVAAPPASSRVIEDMRAPTSIAALLAAMEGVVLEMPGNQNQGAFEQLMFVFSPEKLQVRFTANWVWYDSCAATAAAPRCMHGPFEVLLSPEGVFIARRGCGSASGSAGGNAEFKWSDFVAFGGRNASPKHWTLQRDSFWSNCYFESSSG